MTADEIIAARLAGHHLSRTGNVRTVCGALCGVQAQYFSHAAHALFIRTGGETDLSGLVRTWTIRGTMHLIPQEDIPLFLFRDRRHALRPCDTMQTDTHASENRKAYFAEQIMDAVHGGTNGRDALKEVCFRAGMTDAEARSLFDPWGGLLRALCEEGRLCYRADGKKAFLPLFPFEPMDREAAQLEMAARYFAHYGPATVRDAACFFGERQSVVSRWIDLLPVHQVRFRGKTYYAMDNSGKGTLEIPACLLLSGFDPLMLGYRKEESLHLAPEHIRGIFNLAGNVAPAVLLNGRVAGKWKRRGKKAEVTLLKSASEGERAQIRREAERMGMEAVFAL